MFDRITLWSHLALDFCLLGADYWLHVNTSNWSPQIICSSWFSLGKSHISSNLSISSRLSILLAYNDSKFVIIVYISVKSVSISSLSNPVYMNSLFSWFWLKVYQIYLFKKSAFRWISFDNFSVTFWYLYYLFPLCFFFPPCNSFRWKVRLLLWDFSYFLRSTCRAINIS